MTTALYYFDMNIAMTPRGRLTVKLRVFYKIKENNIAIVFISSAINDGHTTISLCSNALFFYFYFFFI